MNNEKLKILIGCLLFKEFTGSEMYVFELSKNLIKLGHDVSVVSKHIGGPLTEMAKNLGIKIYNLSQPPKNEKFDIIHGQHHPVVSELLKIYPNTPMVCTIHSEVIQLENPIFHPNIKKYIAIRPEIKNHIINNFFPISEKMVDIIYNPIDAERFNKTEIQNLGYTLFVGTIDTLRKNTIFDLINYTKSKNKELWIVGKNHSNYLQNVVNNSHVKYYESTYNVENFVKNCDETAGILLGRTTIEGWMCGKSGWIYNVDHTGKILNKTFNEFPPDIEKFSSENVIKKIKKLYKEIKN